MSAWTEEERKWMKKLLARKAKFPGEFEPRLKRERKKARKSCKEAPDITAQPKRRGPPNAG